MDLDDILEGIGKVFAIIGIALLTGLAVALVGFCLLGWIFAVVAFVNGKVVLGFLLLTIWIIVSGARLSW